MTNQESLTQETPAASTGRQRKRKALAIIGALSGAGLASLATLAAWNDNEWVFGGAGPGGGEPPGVGTSTFNVVQNAWEGTAPAAAAIVDDFESNPGDALVFNVVPNEMSPGTTIYAPVALRSDDDSIAGTLTLQPAVAAVGQTPVDAGGALWDELRYSVRVTDSQATAANCTPTGFASAGTAIVTDQALSAAITPGAQSLTADGGNVQYYCFAVTLPDTPAAQDLQGRVVFPAWRFAATSS